MLQKVINKYIFSDSYVRTKKYDFMEMKNKILSHNINMLAPFQIFLYFSIF